MSKKSFAVGTGAMALRTLLADIMGAVQVESNDPHQQKDKAKQKDCIRQYYLSFDSQRNRFGTSLCPRSDFHYSIESHDEGDQQLHLGRAFLLFGNFWPIYK